MCHATSHVPPSRKASAPAATMGSSPVSAARRRWAVRRPVPPSTRRRPGTTAPPLPPWARGRGGEGAPFPGMLPPLAISAARGLGTPSAGCLAACAALPDLTVAAMLDRRARAPSIRGRTGSKPALGADQSARRQGTSPGRRARARPDFPLPLTRMNWLTLIVLAVLAVWWIKPLRDFLVQRTNRTVKVLLILLPALSLARIGYGIYKGEQDDWFLALLLVSVLLLLWLGLVWLGNTLERRRPTQARPPDLATLSRLPGMPRIPAAVTSPEVQDAARVP